ncbi:hypothetical protein ACGFIW_31340 [Micromonospora sp. NPDC048935]
MSGTRRDDNGAVFGGASLAGATRGGSVCGGEKARRTAVFR